ncbi:MAG TPA: POTRA domain-containing protein [Vicinamibacteria bacterium]|nr:POTRA domain-containing protein [Vicinamibacteria bacterium]
MVRGNALVPEATILHYVGALDDLPRAFRRLWETGLFEDIRFETEDSRLTITVQEKPLLRELRVTAPDAVSARLPPLRQNQPIGEQDARELARAASEIAGENYEASARLEPVSELHVDLVLEVTKRPPRELSFLGNEHVSDDELEKAVRDSPDEDVVSTLRAFYRRRGYARAQIVSRGRMVSILEGEIHRLGEIETDPGSLLSQEDIRAYLPEPGTRFDGDALDESVGRIARYYAERGYPTARVSLEENLRPRTNVVDIRVTVEEGSFYLVDRITFHGNTRHRDRDLRLFCDLAETDRFNGARIESDTLSLMGLGNFRAVVPEVDLTSTPGRASVHYRIEETPLFEYLVGGGLDGTQGATGAGQLVSRSLLGRAETFRIDLDIGNRFQNVAFGYHDPTLLGKRLFFDADFRMADLTFPDETSEDTTEIAIRAYGPHRAPWQFLASARFSAFTLGTELEDDVAFLTPFLGRRFRTFRWSAGLAHRTRWLETGLDWVTGDVELTRWRVGSQVVVPLAPRHSMAFIGRAEALWPYGTSEVEGVPRFERLFLGSENDLRGFPIRGVGPRDAGVVVGGDRLFFATVEHRIEVLSRLTLVGFFDLGNVYATDFEGETLPKARFDAGAEARVVVPLAQVPVRVGYGLNLDRLPDEPRGRFFVTLAVRF